MPPKLPEPKDVIRIKMILAPMQRLKGEGLYEYRHMATKFYADSLDTEKEIEKVMPGRGIEILDRLQNFKTVYLNTKTGEVST